MVTTAASLIWRDYVTDGMPGSGAHAPVKSDIRAWGAEIEPGNLGTAGTGTTAAEFGDQYNHMTVLTMGGTLPDITGGGAQAVGLLIYTFPAGVTRVKCNHMDVGITHSEGFINADQPDVGLGSVIATGANALLSDFGATGEDYVTGQTAANSTGTKTDKSEDTAVAALQLNEAGGVKTLHLNAADTWAASGDSAATLSGTVTIEWTFLST